MDLTQIRYFLAVAEALNFTRAAERCNVTQPALTRAVQRLEEELGGALILRERALTQLTELGRAMLPLLRQTVEAAEAVHAGAAGFARGGGAAPLRIGVARWLPLHPLLPPLREVIAAVRGTELAGVEDAPAPLMEALLRGALDVAVLPAGSDLPERLSRWPLWAQRVAVLLPAAHPLAAREALGAADLAAEVMLASPCADMLTEGGCVPHEAGSPAGLEALVALGLGLALVPAMAPRLPECVARPVEALSLPVVLAAPAGRPMNAAVGAFVRLARARRWEA